jgi:adenosine deaminase
VLPSRLILFDLTFLRKNLEKQSLNSLKKKKYIGINLMKEEKDISNVMYKSVKKEIEKDIRRWKDLPCSWI